jgi:oligosaccharide repeat unit polymerase
MIKIKSKDLITDTVLLGLTVLMMITAELLNVLGGGHCEAAVHVILFAIVLLNIAIFCDLFRNIRRDFPILVFVAAFDVLLLGRVYVSYFGHYRQMLVLLETDSYAKLFVALRMIIVSLFCVYLAYRLAGPIFHKRETAIQEDGIKSVKINPVGPIIRQLSVAVLLVSSIAFFYTLFQTVLIVLKHGYLNSFTNTTRIPSSISRLSMFFIPAFAVFLATLPNKKQMKLPLAIYGLYMVTSIFTGRRNMLVTEALMLIIYFVMRDNLLERNKRVLKKKTVVYMGIMGIAAMYLLQLFAIVRAGITDANKNLGAMIVSFFDSQGASFRVVIQTVNNIHLFNPSTSYQYLFYPFERFVHNNVITRSLFGLTPIIEVQNDVFVKTTHNYAHALTYAVDPERYLSGGGFGTSYVAEAYIAYGILGVILVSLMVGLIFRFFSSMLTRSWVAIACCLLAIKDFVYIPRSFAFIWVTDVFNITYLCFYGAIYLIALVIVHTATHLRQAQSAAPPFALEEKS